MTVRQLRAEMPSSEYAQWMGFYQYQLNRRDQRKRKKETIKDVKKKLGS